MYEIDSTPYGFRLLLYEQMNLEEARRFRQELNTCFENATRPFSVFVDMRHLEPLEREAQAEVTRVQQAGRESGVVRSVIILNNPTLTHQFKRIALQSDIYDIERYIDASTDKNWEENGLKWMTDGIDPDAEWREEIAKRRKSLQS